GRRLQMRKLALAVSLVAAIGIFYPSSGQAICNETETFAPAVNVNTGNYPHDVVLDDFNGDGNLDLVVANSGDNRISVHMGLGNGSFAGAIYYPTGSGPFGLAVG